MIEEDERHNPGDPQRDKPYPLTMVTGKRLLPQRNFGPEGTDLVKRRVCCFCERWESGGIEAFLCNVLLHMDLSHLEVDIVAARLEESVFTQSLKARGVGFYQLSGKLRSPANGRFFLALLKRRNYDVIHLNAYQGLSLAYLRIARKAKVPVRIAHSHNTQLRRSGTQALKLMIHRWAKAWYSKEPTFLLACSKPAAEFLFERMREYTFIPNGIDVGRFHFDPEIRARVRKELGLENIFIVGNVGRLCSQKNQGFLLDVFYEIHRCQPESALLLVGEGADWQALNKKATDLGISDNVIFYGTTSQVEQLYWAMDVFAFPSWFEGLGIAAIEAQAAGLPVVASENVPKEARITDSFQTLPLGFGAEKWAQAILARRDGDLKREAGAAIVQGAGFDVWTVAESIREIWTR